MATKKQLRDELFAIKFALRDALLKQLATMGDVATKDALYQDVWTIWKWMNSQDYK